MLGLCSLSDYLLGLMWPSPGVCSLYGRATGSMVRVKATSSKRTYANTLCLPGLLLPAPLTPQQATVDPLLCSRSPNTHRQIWLNLLWGHCSFLLGSSIHKILFVLSKSLCLPTIPCCPLWKFCSSWNSPVCFFIRIFAVLFL